MRVLITGSNGFIGQSLIPDIHAKNISLSLAMRSLLRIGNASYKDVVCYEVGDISLKTNWTDSLVGVNVVIHCAARAHIINETETDALFAYREVNVAGTKNLAEQAVKAGVSRFVFLSSIGVNGIHTNRRTAFTINDISNPVEDYAQSKYEAEQALHEVAVKTGLEVVIIRPPLVYGPEVKGNFLRLMQLIDKGVPLPLGLASNARSLVGLDNLVDLLIHCVDHPAAAGQTLLVSDGEDLSTPDLIRRMARMMGRSPRLLPVPVWMMRLAGRLSGKSKEVDRLVGSLQVDSQYTRDVLDWVPPVSLEKGLKKTVDWYMTQR